MGVKFRVPAGLGGYFADRPEKGTRQAIQQAENRAGAFNTRYVHFQIRTFSPVAVKVPRNESGSGSRTDPRAPAWG